MEFLEDEVCARCGGPLIAQAEKRQQFIEETLDYLEQSVWICYACGHENPLDSEPRYIV